jgi:hypothetical protein
VIEGPDFVWLHFPHCASSATERCLRRLWGADTRWLFDPVNHADTIRYDTIAERQARDPNFVLAGRRVVSNFRRLPDWLLSHVHDEAQHAPHHTPTREMLARGEFITRQGAVRRPDDMLRDLQPARVSAWIRAEHLEQDLARVFNVREADVAIGLPASEPQSAHIRDPRFWFTPNEFANLYRANPRWAELEASLYGDVLDRPLQMVA